jgi:hypothetical protein
VEWVAAAARGEGADVGRALARTVEVAALAHLAREAGLDRLASLRDEARDLLVRLYLRREAEIADPPGERDLRDLRRLYDERVTYFVHPELRTVEHLVVVLAERGRRGASAPSFAPEDWEAMRAVVRDFMPLVRGASSGTAFAALRETLERRVKERWKAAGAAGGRPAPRVVQERIGPVDRESAYDPAFLAAAFSLQRLGDVAGPVRTAFGWHVVFLSRLEPPRRVPFESALPEILEKGGPNLEASRAVSLVQAARTRRGARSHPDRLDLTMGGAGSRGP